MCPRDRFTRGEPPGKGDRTIDDPILPAQADITDPPEPSPNEGVGLVSRTDADNAIPDQQVLGDS
jgi:hypothetical protein